MAPKLTTCKECGVEFELDSPNDHPICPECADEIAEAEDEENEIDFDKD